MLFSTERAHNKCFSHSDSIIISSLHKYLSASSAMSFVLSISGLLASCMPAITRALDFLLSVGFYSHIRVILPKKQNRKFWGGRSVCLTMRPQRVLGTSLNPPGVCLAMLLWVRGHLLLTSQPPVLPHLAVNCIPSTDIFYHVKLYFIIL